MTADPASKPSVLFVCERNAGRSQMAAGFLASLSRGMIDVRSAGIRPSHEVSPSVVEAMAEAGVDISGEVPKELTTGAVQEADVVITMGCGDDCPVFPGKRYEDWELADPAGRGIDSIRPVRDEIRTRVEALVTELLPARHADAQ
jgi:arsenate reductase